MTIISIKIDKKKEWRKEVWKKKEKRKNEKRKKKKVKKEKDNWIFGIHLYSSYNAYFLKLLLKMYYDRYTLTIYDFYYKIQEKTQYK